LNVERRRAGFAIADAEVEIALERHGDERRQETPVQRDPRNTDSGIREDRPAPRVVVGDRRNALS
jgi:hypothetical protein